MNSARRVFTEATRFHEIIKYYVSIADDSPIHIPKVPKNISSTALAIALNEKNYYTVPLLMDKNADPNYIVSPELIDMIKNNVPMYGNQSKDELITFSNLRDQLIYNHPQGLAAFYFARCPELVDECIYLGKADVTLRYVIPTPYGTKYGNIISYIVDNACYPAALIQYYLKKGAGPYAQSYASNGGSTLHHIVHMLNISNGQDKDKLYECAQYLIATKPDLLNSKDHNDNTPIDCLNINMQHNQDIFGLNQQFLELLGTKKSSRE